MAEEETPKEELNAGWYYVPEYWPAIYLALNHAAGGLTIHDVMYAEEYDCFFVELSDTTEYYGGTYYDMGFKLEGAFVRSCFKAVKEGVTSWIPKET